jgi:hypothetical protein
VHFEMPLFSNTGEEFKRDCRKSLFRALLSWGKSIFKANLPGHNSYSDYDQIYTINPTHTAWVLVLLSTYLYFAFLCKPIRRYLSYIVDHTIE